MKSRIWVKTCVTAFITLLPLLASGAEMDQEAQAPAQKTASEVLNMEKIIVTARKGEESAEDVPFSLTVLDGNEVETRRLESIEEMLRQTPSVEVTNWGGTDTAIVRMRGVGTLQKVSFDDSSVVINLDGIPMSATSATLNTMDIEQVEILKGPQGTLMGRNSEAGAINITTRKPTDYLEGYTRGEYGEENTRLVEGAVGGPVTEKLGARLAFRYSGYDNPVQYYNTDNPVTRPWDMAVRGTLAWKPDSKTSATFIASHEQIENRATLDVLMPYGDDPEVDVPKDSYDEDKSIERVSLELKHEFDNFIGSSLTGYSYADQERKSCIYNGITFRKYLGMTGDGSWRWGYQEDTFNQEFRLSSKPKDKIFWVAGVSGNISERDVDSKDSYDNFRPSYWMNAVYDKNFTTYSGGIFGEATYPLTEKLKVTGGIRYSWERKEYSANWAAKPSNPSPIRTARDSHELNDDYPTGRAALSYEAIENLNLYAVYARGYKSGGFSEYATGFINGIKSDLIYKPAVVDSYEVGFKSELPNLNAGISGAFFYNDTRDEHLLVFDSSTYVSVPENFDTRSMGVELNGYWKIGYGFTLSAGGGYTDAEIKSVPGDSVSGAEKGNRVPDTPKWNATVSLGHALPLPDFLGMHSPVLTSKITNRYIGERYGSADNYFKLDSYNELDLKISLAGEHVEIYLWADNLLDERYELSAWYFGQSFVDGSLVSIAVPSRGRVIGGGLAYYF